jgi:hypothetical protein
VAVAGLGLASRGGAASADDAALINDLKVAYLYNFTHFIEWPRAPAGTHFDICVVGAPDLAEAARALERSDKTVDGRRFLVRPLGPSAPLEGCRMLVMGEGAVGRLDELVERSAGKPILLVGDAPGLARRGAAIGFVLRPDILGKGGRLRFEINPSALKGRGLRVSAQLYDVAEIVQ